ncbi:type II toxin-antitoxin system RelE/ParE family toxin [Terriglobus sp.]|uniref:type II toxin-antitoxin system RelE/ParE family toxin n=1 Tax=Terriglobus sp. TaxID=1889013 RepID=UPI003B00EDFF
MTHRLSPEAEAELDGIWEYIATESGSLVVADRFIDGLTRQFYLLATHPYMGHRRDEDLRPGMRSFVFGSYLILYRTEGEDVLILHVVRGSRDIVALFGH